MLAQTARTAQLETVDDLAVMLDDLWRRVDGAGRDRAEIDVSFGCGAGGSASSPDFDAVAHLDGLASLAALGVTWVHVGIPGDSVAHAVETLERYGEAVIAAR